MPERPRRPGPGGKVATSLLRPLHPVMIHFLRGHVVVVSHEELGDRGTVSTVFSYELAEPRAWLCNTHRPKPGPGAPHDWLCFHLSERPFIPPTSRRSLHLAAAASAAATWRHPWCHTTLTGGLWPQLEATKP